MSLLALAVALTGSAAQKDDLFEGDLAHAELENMCARSLVSQGDLARLQQALAKARRGDPVTIGVIGGSITLVRVRS